jgi:hypothetical protein
MISLPRREVLHVRHGCTLSGTLFRGSGREDVDASGVGMISHLALTASVIDGGGLAKDAAYSRALHESALVVGVVSSNKDTSVLHGGVLSTLHAILCRTHELGDGTAVASAFDVDALDVGIRDAAAYGARVSDEGTPRIGAPTGRAPNTNTNGTGSAGDGAAGIGMLDGDVLSDSVSRGSMGASDSVGCYTLDVGIHGYDLWRMDTGSIHVCDRLVRNMGVIDSMRRALEAGGGEVDMSLLVCEGRGICDDTLGASALAGGGPKVLKGRTSRVVVSAHTLWACMVALR